MAPFKMAQHLSVNRSFRKRVPSKLETFFFSMDTPLAFPWIEYQCIKKTAAKEMAVEHRMACVLGGCGGMLFRQGVGVSAAPVSCGGDWGPVAPAVFKAVAPFHDGGWVRLPSASAIFCYCLSRRSYVGRV